MQCRWMVKKQWKMSYVTCERPLGRMGEVGIDSVKGDPALGFPLAAIPYTAHLTGKPDGRKAAPFSGPPALLVLLWVIKNFYSSKDCFWQKFWQNFLIGILLERGLRRLGHVKKQSQVQLQIATINKGISKHGYNKPIKIIPMCHSKQLDISQHLTMSQFTLLIILPDISFMH